MIFVGKLIVSKGVDLLLAAWPLVHRGHPSARLLIVGFGALAPALQRVSEGLARGGPRAAARARRARPRRSRTARTSGCGCSPPFLERLPDGYEDAARGAAGSVEFAGRLEHDEVAVPVSASDALVFPSTFPEAFGMVAAEAAVRRRAARLGRALGRRRGQPGARRRAAGRGQATWSRSSSATTPWRRSRRGCAAGSALDQPDRVAASASLRETVERLWSWESVARGVLAASAGRARRASRSRRAIEPLETSSEAIAPSRVAAINRIATTGRAPLVYAANAPLDPAGTRLIGDVRRKALFCIGTCSFREPHRCMPNNGHAAMLLS